MIRRTPFVNVCSQGYGWGLKNILVFACLLLILKSNFQHYDHHYHHHYHHHDYHCHCLSQCQGKFIITSSGGIDIIIIIIIIISLVTAICTVTLQFICSYHFKRNSLLREKTNLFNFRRHIARLAGSTAFVGSNWIPVV